MTAKDDERFYKWRRDIEIILFCIYSILVLSYTVFTRSIGIYSAHTKLFWSYEEWFTGNWLLGREILKNIAMFVPVGFLLAAVLRSRRILVTFVSSVFLSSSIELLQLILMRGVFEFDDILSNTLGAIIGCIIFTIGSRIGLFPKKSWKRIILIGFSLNIALLYLLLSTPRTDASARSFCFQIDNAELEENGLSFDGFAFLYSNNQAKGELSLELRSVRNGNRIWCKTEHGVLRDDVGDYFGCGNGYSDSGFKATVANINFDEEYEVFINWGWRNSVATGVFVTGEDIHYFPENYFIQPNVTNTGLSEVVNNGYLRVYRPDQHCWVYQHNGYLYWIVDKEFDFKENANTYIQFQLWTTQPENLPQKRIDNGWDWDNIGSYFENHEITDDLDCGEYRVCRRALPTQYSITAILTGSYQDKWIWKNIFRPYYEFE